MPSFKGPQERKGGLAVHYAAAPAAAPGEVLGEVLGVIGFNAARPPGLPPGLPYLAAPLAPAGGGPCYEIWTAGAPTAPLRAGPVAGTRGEDVAFGCVRLEEAPGQRLEEAVERAYLAIFDFLADSGLTQPLRFWNYLHAILAEEDGLERYRRFNIGRHRAFLARLAQALPPAASCVGGEGESVIYFLAAREAARPIENPRQVSAYDYPAQYGPRSPSFSRAGLSGGRLFISGTASIVGHESRHHGDLLAQAHETIANLRALTRNAGLDEDFARAGGWAFKIYLRDPADQARVAPLLDAAFGAQAQKLYLHGVVCRPDLLLEIEAFRAAG